MKRSLSIVFFFLFVGLFPSTSLAKTTPAPTISSTKALVKSIAKAHGVSPSLALNIACAESQFRSKISNANSSAGGVFQFLDGSWSTYAKRYFGTTKGYSKYNAADNIELAVLVLKHKGTSDWNASKYTGLGGGWASNPYQNGYCGSIA